VLGAAAGGAGRDGNDEALSTLFFPVAAADDERERLRRLAFTKILLYLSILQVSNKQSVSARGHEQWSFASRRAQEKRFFCPPRNEWNE
jgi:hypothetical protein